MSVETPDQLQQRLEKMGESRVRALVGQGYFEPKKATFVQGWLDGKTRERSNGKPGLEEILTLVGRANEAAAKAQEEARQATESAKKTQRLTLAALAVGSLGLLVSILTLFALALR